MTATARTLPTTAQAGHSPLRRRLLPALVNWLVERDRRYREGRKLAAQPAERLLDMGITSEAARAGSSARPGGRPAEAAPVPTGQW